jgi:hypothetical protein
LGTGKTPDTGIVALTERLRLNELPAEIGKLLTGHDYGGDA